MPLWNRSKKANPKPERSDDELRALLRQQVFSDLSREGAFVPQYRTDILSEEDFEARLPTMPIVTVWGEQWTDEGLAFSLSVNIGHVAATMERYIRREDLWFRDEYHRIVNELKRLVQGSIIATVEKTGASPSQICAAAAQTSCRADG